MAESLILSLVTAIAGFVGATRLERLRWRRAAVVNAEERERAIRRGVRLVERELREAEARIVRATRRGHFSTRDRRFSTTEWDEHRAELAAALDGGDWQRVCEAYDAIVDLNEILDERLAALADSTPEGFGQAVATAIAEVRLSCVRNADELEFRWRAIRTASWILRTHAEDAGKVEWAIEEYTRIACELWPASKPTAPQAAV